MNKELCFILDNKNIYLDHILIDMNIFQFFSYVKMMSVNIIWHYVQI